MFLSISYVSCVVLAFVSQLPITNALPTSPPPLPILTALDLTPNNTEDGIFRRTIAGGHPLRILPLGASIMYGYLSTDGNGCRWGLRGALRALGNEVNMIGSVTNPAATMGDPQCEGWPGYRIDQLNAKAALSTPSQPNLVLIQAGTNDVGQNYDIANAHVRMTTLINQIFDAVPNTVIVLGTLFPNANAATDANNELVSNNYKTVVKTMQAAGKKISIADFRNGWFTATDFQPDGTHPTDAGYLKMGRVFYDAILKIESTISAPATVSGVDDGIYVHTATYHSQNLNKGPAGGTLDGVMWADLNGDGKDDFIWVSDTKTFGVALNTGPGTYGTYGTYTPNIDCPKAGVRFGDLNADGRADAFCIHADGSMSAWLNTAATDARFPTFTAQGIVMQTQSDPLAQIRLADIDGDGRIDYVAIRNNGDIVAWRNGGNGNTIAYWQDFGTIFPAGTITDTAGIQFVDLNGDGRSDLVYVNANAQVTTWINQRGFASGSIAPAWSSSGVTHGGQSSPSRPKLSWARVWGTQKYDYIISSDAATSVSWGNTGVGGTTLKSDGNYYCDMTGSGREDYVNIAPNGQVTFFQNINNPPLWGTSYGVIYTVTKPRKEVHLADMDGDGKCDIVYVNKETGAITVIKNNGIVNRAFSFSAPVAGPSNLACTQGYGVGLTDLGVRFADLDGDGKADYLCIQPDVYTTGYINTGSNTFQNVGQIKLSISLDRANIRYVDINNDKRADLIWIDKYTGAARVWLNAGKIPASGSAFTWTDEGILFPARTGRGPTVFFADLNGDGRSEYIVAQPSTNLAWMWGNNCVGGGKGVAAPALPVDPFA